MTLTRADLSRIGPSDIGAITRLDPHRTPLSVYARIVAGTEQADNPSLSRGRHLEPAVLAMYLERTGAEVLERAAPSRHVGDFWRLSLDGRVNRDGRRVVEVKTAGRSEVGNWGEPGTDQIPQQYIFQTTLYGGMAMALGLVDSADVDVAALVAGDLAVYSVPFSAELFAMLQAAAERFWVDHVVPRKPPPPSEPFADLEALRGLYARENGNARDFASFTTPEQAAILAWLEAKRAKDAAEALCAAAEVQVKLALGECSGVLSLPEGGRIDWKQHKAGRVTDWNAAAKAIASRWGVPASDWDAIVKRFTTTKEGARPMVVRGRKGR